MTKINRKCLRTSQRWADYRRAKVRKGKEMRGHVTFGRTLVRVIEIGALSRMMAWLFPLLQHSRKPRERDRQNDPKVHRMADGGKCDKGDACEYSHDPAIIKAHKEKNDKRPEKGK